MAASSARASGIESAIDPSQAAFGSTDQAYIRGQAVQVLSKSSNAWVDATVLDVLEEGSVRVCYGNAQKLVPPELLAVLLRPPCCAAKPPVPSTAQLQMQAVAQPIAAQGTELPTKPQAAAQFVCSAPAYAAGQRVEVYSKTQQHWVQGIVREVWPDGSIHVQYAAAQHLYKVVSPELQACMIRTSGASGVSENAAALPQQQQSQVAELIEESERLRATILEQQQRINDLVVQQEIDEAAPIEVAVPDEDNCWSCAVCTFGNLDSLDQCEMCGAPRQPTISSPDGFNTACQPPQLVAIASSAGAGWQCWRCQACSFQNPGAGNKCNVCDMPRDGTTPTTGMRSDSAPGDFLKSATMIVEHTPAEPRRSPRLQQLLPQSPKIEAFQDVVEVLPAEPSSSSSSRPKLDVYEDLVEISVAETSSGSAAVAPLRLPRKLHDHLCPYQREGAAWMWHLYQKKHGGILADDMGLGKTVQTCALIQATRSSGPTHALVVMPVTLLDQWARELRKWCPGCPVYIYHGSAAHRSNALRAVRRPRGGVLLTSYAIVKTENERLSYASMSTGVMPTTHGEQNWLAKPGKRPLGGEALRSAEKPWDLVICDEAHVMRSVSTLLGKALRKLQSSCRILLTGTPVQNALQDLWALMDFAQPGLLGNRATFAKSFNDPIEKGSMRGAGASAVALKKHLSDQLLQLIKPHMLRRTKEVVGLPADIGATSPQCLSGELQRPLPPKTEIVVWLLPSKEQVRAYQKALETSDIIHEANSKTKLGVEVFRAIGLLKRLCNHPALGLATSEPDAWREILATPAEGLLSPSELKRFVRPCAKPKAGKQGKQTQDVKNSGKQAQELAVPEAAQELEYAQADGAAAESAEAGKAVERILKGLKRDVSSMITQSAKLRCLSALLPVLEAGGHRTLIFSQGVKMMDVVEICVLRRQGIKYLRIDGQTDRATRAERVEQFQNGRRDQYTCMLLTTSVGGFGLNLTSADRVILLDPAWNPAVDMQAVDRVYRIGQEREVKTYRLIMSGLIEDKMFRLQVFKMGLTKTALETKQQHRYFTAEEIHGLFEWVDPAKGETRRLLLEKHGEEGLAPTTCDGAHEGWLKAGPAAGLSNFSTLYSSLAGNEEDDLDCSDPEVRLMKSKLKTAEQSVQKAAEARISSEISLSTAQQGMQQALEQIAAAATERGATSKRLKEAQAALQHARKEEVATERLAEKAWQIQETARVQLARADENRLNAERSAAALQQQAEHAAVVLSQAELAFTETLAEGEAQLQGMIGAPAAKLGAASKALDRLRKAAASVVQVRVDVSSAWCEELCAEEKFQICQAELAVCKQYGNGQLKTRQAELKVAEKEHVRAGKAAVKIADMLSSANESVSEAVSEMRQTMKTLAGAMPGAGGQATQPSAGSAELTVVIRSVASAWQACKTASDARSKAHAMYMKAARAVYGLAAGCKEPQAKKAAADVESAKLSKEMEGCRNKVVASESEVSAAMAACAAAEERETTQKRKRDECRAAIGEARQSLKSCKVAERDAAAGRNAMYKHYAQTDDKLKDELKNAKNVAQASVEEQHKAIAAIQALQAEEYDANQVIEAYESKKRPRQEAETE
eukprot:TRINITY_DN44993_c0_g1_i1.p1 TRINITY_DN44993_c0_g1~~TRINITY_DN44993_c0_g1_i1.p1  ORF type:complete len:1597 (+),score=383.03 TRINITY_DN44993_c0_g1_i1:35-4825(+)